MAAPYPNPNRRAVEPLAAASVELLGAVRAAMLPRPGREHYRFGVRDLVRLAQGLQLASKHFHDNQARPAPFSHSRAWRRADARAGHGAAAAGGAPTRARGAGGRAAAVGA